MNEIIKIESLHKDFKKADRLEDILCLSVLIATGLLPVISGIDDSTDYYVKIQNCALCPAVNRCLACIINQ